MQVFSALSQLDFGSEVWERVLLQAFELLTESNDEPLVAAMSFVFKAASQCHHLPQAVCVHAPLDLYSFLLFFSRLLCSCSFSLLFLYILFISSLVGQSCPFKVEKPGC